jgi:hypothetical protein
MEWRAAVAAAAAAQFGGVADNMTVGAADQKEAAMLPDAFGWAEHTWAEHMHTYTNSIV